MSTPDGLISAKYPRSYHLPWSPGSTTDDKRMADVTGLIGVDLVITEKMDGGNQAYTRDATFARSHSAKPVGESYDFIKAQHAQLRHLIEPGITIFGENCFALHSIRYTSLPDYFLVFGVREDRTGLWWSWEMVEMQASLLGLSTVPVLFRGQVDTIGALQELTETISSRPSTYGTEREGVVVRVAQEFTTVAFKRSLGKWVRADHVKGEHWMFRNVERQGLAPGG